MNKIKVLYDMAKVMKSKEFFKGTLAVQVHKDEAQVFSLRNEFEKNLQTGEVKAKIKSELDYEGKAVKHESNTEFAMPRPGECRRHEFMRHLHHHPAGCGGLRDKWTKLAFVFSALAALKVEEQEDKTIVVAINATDLPEDSKVFIREAMNRAAACHHRGPGFLKEFWAAQDIDFVITVTLNKNYEVEKLVSTFVGTVKDDQNAAQDLTARAELSMVW